MWGKSSSTYVGDISQCFCDMEVKARVQESPGRDQGKNQSGWVPENMAHAHWRLWG